MTTTVPMMTSSWYDSGTTDNTSWIPSTVTFRPHKVHPDRLLEIRARYLPIILTAIPANFGLFILILCARELRSQPFFLGVLSITIFDLCNGIFALPMGMEHQMQWANWRHGDAVCIAFSVLVISKTYMSALMNIALCIERLLAKLRSVATISEKTATTVSRIIIALPWCIGVLACAPLIVSNRRNLAEHFTQDRYCVFMLEQDFHVPAVVSMYLVPLSLLLLIPVAMVLVYKFKGAEWSRLSVDTDSENNRLRMSTLSVWVVSVIYLALYIPLTVVVVIIITCSQNDFLCFPEENLYKNCFTLSHISSAVTPFCWLMTVEVRSILASIMSRLTAFIRRRTDAQKNVLSFSSLKNKTTADVVAS